MTRARLLAAFGCWATWVIASQVAAAHPSENDAPRASITDRSVAWPTWDQWHRVILLRDYNTRVVIMGTTLLGCAGGIVGSFTLLRKRALMGDALSHATLPGICLAFIIVTALGGDGKALPWLLTGATLTGLIGVGAILVIRNLTRIKEDTALGIVLSVFFGSGVALLGVIQQMKDGHAAGLEAFIYGKTASMGVNDALLIAAAAMACVAGCLLLFKEFKILCFDEQFAGSRGVPVVRLDLALMSLVVIVCIVGMQAVGLILIIALIVIPAAAARFWTEKMSRMVVISACLGAAGGMVGAGMSALLSKLPSGAMIVLVCTFFFLLSMVFGSARGVLIRQLRRAHLNRTVDRHHLLRALYEILDASADTRDEPGRHQAVSRRELLARRSWSERRLSRATRRAERAQLVYRTHDHQLCLTDRGLQEAARLTRQHRLWELYLITYADTAPNRVDQDADAIEHVLEPEIVAELESLLAKARADVPASPHELAARQTEADQTGADQTASGRR